MGGLCECIRTGDEVLAEVFQNLRVMFQPRAIVMSFVSGLTCVDTRQVVTWSNLNGQCCTERQRVR
jgi:hypothetical protein